MGLTTTRKKEIIQEYKNSEKDTGSSEIQVAILTRRISDLTAHLKNHPKDYHTRLGLSKMVTQRTRLLTYLRKTDIGRYKTIIGRLGLRR